MPPRPQKPRLLVRLGPDANLILQAPLRRASNPAFKYLDALPSPSSQRVMGRALERIAELFPLEVRQINWSRLTYNHVWSIREALAKRYSPATVNQSLSALRGVLGLAHQGRTSTQAYQAVGAVPLVPPVPRRSHRVLSEKQMDRLIRTAREDRSPKSLRDVALLGLIAGAGLKRSEVSILRLSDFQPITGELKVRTRVIRVEKAERSFLWAWIRQRGRAPGPLFLPVNKGGRVARRPMSGQAVAAVVTERAVQAGLGSLSPEELRRAFLASRPT